MSIIQTLFAAGMRYAVNRVARAGVGMDAKTGASDRKKGWHGAGSGKSSSSTSAPPKHEPMLKLAIEHSRDNDHKIIEAQRQFNAEISDARRRTTASIELAGRTP